MPSVDALLLKTLIGITVYWVGVIQCGVRQICRANYEIMQVELLNKGTCGKQVDQL
jgi:hypothetical protein